MCQPTDISSASSSQSPSPPPPLKEARNIDGPPSLPSAWPRLLYSLESFRNDSMHTSTSVSSASSDHDDASPTKYRNYKESYASGAQPPRRRSFALTVAVVVLGLCGVELALRCVLQHYQHVHPLLSDERNRQILARHVGVDALSCGLCSYFGWISRRSMPTLTLLWQAMFGSKSKTNKVAFPTAACDERLYTYYPEAVRCALVFFAYQIKNLHDSYVWNDGVEFLFHHVFSLITAWGSLYPGCGHFYIVFFFGISEISTAVLCLLANFDDQHGVIGLDRAFPLMKVILGGLFVTLFIICRCILWPIVSYYFGRDVLLVLHHHQHDPRTQQRKNWMKFFLISLAGLSVLQVAWLGQIVIIAQDELTKLGFL